MDCEGDCVCELCGGSAWLGDCVSASGFEIVCDDCLDTLSKAEKDYIEGRGAKAGRWA